MFYHLRGWGETPRPELFGRHGVFIEGNAVDFQGNPDAAALPLPARISELLVELEPVFRQVQLSQGTFVLRALPAYGTSGKDPLDSPDLHFFAFGHIVVIPASMGHFGGSVNTHGSLSATCPIY